MLSHLFQFYKLKKLLPQFLKLFQKMFDHNSIMALKQLIGGEEEQMQMVQNAYKGSVLNPGAIGSSSDDKQKQVAKPFAKIQAKIGQKYVPKGPTQNTVTDKMQQLQESKSKTNDKKVSKKHEIWSEQQVAELPIIKQDPRPRPQLQVFYRQKVGTEDVFLGMSGVDPSSNHCHEITYKIYLPNTQTKQIQLDLNQKQMVIQTKKFYLIQHFMYKVQSKKARAKFIADKGILELILPIIRNDDF